MWQRVHMRRRSLHLPDNEHFGNDNRRGDHHRHHYCVADDDYRESDADANDDRESDADADNNHGCDYNDHDNTADHRAVS